MPPWRNFYLSSEKPESPDKYREFIQFPYVIYFRFFLIIAKLWNMSKFDVFGLQKSHMRILKIWGKS